MLLFILSFLGLLNIIIPFFANLLFSSGHYRGWWDNDYGMFRHVNILEHILMHTVFLPYMIVYYIACLIKHLSDR